MAAAPRTVEEEVAQLQAELIEHNRRYHQEDNATISDYEYDRLFHKLKALEEAHPHTVVPNSPTQTVGYSPVAPAPRQKVSGYQKNKQYPGPPVSHKTWMKERGVWVRRVDCAIAEYITGYNWYELKNSKTDFCDNSFKWFLCKVGNDRTYVLEPDTRVPNYSTNMNEALDAARIAGYDDMNINPQLETHEIATAICMELLSLTPYDGA